MIDTRQQAIREAINILNARARVVMPGRAKSMLLNAAAQLRVQVIAREPELKSLIGIMHTKPQRGGKFWLRTGPLGPKIPNLTSRDVAAAHLSGRR